MFRVCYKKYISIVTTLAYYLYSCSIAHAGIFDFTENVANSAGYSTAVSETSLSGAAGSFVFLMLSLFGVLFTILVVYGGYTWMMARGNEEIVEKGKKIIRTAITGLIITFGAFSIWLLVQEFIMGQ